MQLDLNSVSKVIATQFADIAFAYLFGSSKEGWVKEGSDVDIAIYYTGKDPFVQFRVAEVMEKAFPGLIFDIVELQKAGPILAFEALKGFQLFVKQDVIDVYVDFYTLTCRLYEDRIYWMKKQLEYRGYEVQWDN